MIAATGRKSIDKAIAAGDLDGTYARREAHPTERLKLGHHKEDVEVPWREENVSESVRSITLRVRRLCRGHIV
jgi:hypothetical protein